MRFNCNKDELSKALSIVSRAVSNKSTLPVLKGILIKAFNEGKVELSASDNDMSIRTVLEAEVFDEGSVVAPARMMSDIVRKLPEGDVFFKAERERAEISCNFTEFKMVCLPADEFPEERDEAAGESIVLDREMLSDMIKRVAFAASIDEARGIITGVVMEIKSGFLTMVALDGFRLALMKARVEEKTKEGKIIVHGRMMNEVGKILAEINTEKDSATGEEGKVRIAVDDKKAVFSIKGTHIVTRLMEGNYIKYEDVIPRAFAMEAVVAAEELKESVDRASIMLSDGKNAHVVLLLSDEEIQVKSKSDEGFASDVVAAVKKGDDLRIGFNGRFLLDVLKAVPDEEVRMGFNSPTAACVIKPMEGEKYTYMVLPVRLPAGF